ncbi:hypothetical protein Goshw_027680 [Gossypium schwendimanii]|uniref:RING-type domain-containing protein n=1 Tax=Gossypium schwendimanii TaxID=34291 RepID=A0A7J9M873_GOSSC|nr:hypothetical protein [Gossypium schwendimanii]
MTSASVVLIGNNITLSFDDVEANFAPAIEGTGKCGILYLANPLDACSDLSNKVEKGSNITSPFALVIRGGCSFDDKVRRVQKAGFEAAIVYDNDDDMFYSIVASSCWIMEGFQEEYHIRRERSRSSRVREFHGMSRRLVKAMPSLIFTAVLDDNSTSRTCAVCLEDYTMGEKLRILPCHHKFHAFCIDSWLTTWRTFCPVCKRDARTTVGDLPASESTPLLSTSPSSVSSVLSCARSRIASSSSIQIDTAAWTSPPASHAHSLASVPSIQPSVRSYCHSPSMSYSRSSVDLRNASSHLVSPASLNYPSISPLNARYMSQYFPSPSNASPSLVRSSSRRLYPLHCSESAASFSPFASAQSLPEC